jgi:hypothetical protein
MRVIEIPKGNGRTRTIYAPSRQEKRHLRGLLPALAHAERQAAQALGVQDVAHGFIEGRNPVTCAQPHIGFAVTITTDLAGWFDSIWGGQIRAGLRCAEAEALWDERLLYEDRPRQGLPTSPVCANLAALYFDHDVLVTLRANFGERFAYTRYADDLTVSIDEEDPPSPQWVVSVLESFAMQQSWNLAPGKTKIQRARAGRRVIVGVSVGETDLKVPRAMRRKLRAAQHQDAESPHARGLANWCQLSLPKCLRPKRSTRRIAGLAGVSRESGQNTCDTPFKNACQNPSQGVLVGGGRRILFRREQP